ncbi:MAG TPA: SpoIIE family protein phosphatase, partial [Pirellulales bacterium]|nr:SpoIIE family protein phosphatase [Pirellulales bacterium]
SIPNYLRLFQERLPDARDAVDDACPVLSHLCRSFQRATGWSLRHVPADSTQNELDAIWSAPVEPDFGTVSGRLAIAIPDLVEGVGARRIERESASDLAAAVAELLRELASTRRALRHREADLAAGIPLLPRPNSERHLADRLAAVLRGGAEAIGCHAAALYLLDEATSELKLRSSWNLPPDRLTAGARPLARATADLEALAGHAVVLEEAQSFQNWNPPEAFAAAVCVPVSSSRTPLGTFWVFSRHARTFSDREVQIAEVVAGRLASDLEREVLLAQGAEGARIKRHWLAAERWQQNQVPRIAPLVDDWDMAGWTQVADGIGGGFFDWFVRTDDSLGLAVGDSLAYGLEAALAAGALRAALRSHAQFVSEPQKLMELVNRTIWTISAGDQGASVFYATATCTARSGQRKSGRAGGNVCYASAGNAGAYLLSVHGCQSLLSPTLALGLGPNTQYAAHEMNLESGEALLVVSEGGRSMLDAERRLFGDEPLAQSLVEHLDAPAATLADLVHDRLEALTGKAQRHDCSVLVVKLHPSRSC